MVGQIRKLIRYFLGKSSEVRDFNVKDILLAKTVLDIRRMNRVRRLNGLL